MSATTMAPTKGKSQVQTSAPPPASSQEAVPVSAPDPDRDPIGYLRHHGWKCDGDPKRRTSRWLDPTKPAVAKDEKVKIGEKLLPGDKREDVFQVFHTPAVWPIGRDEAVLIQQDRDEAARQAAEKEAAEPAADL